MSAQPRVTGIDPGSWKFEVLPFPKRFTRGAAHGFCGGHAVGRVEAARSQMVGCWWPSGKPALLTLEGHEVVTAGRAAGSVIPGQWIVEGDLGAICWTLRDGKLSGRDLPATSNRRTWATAAGGDVVIGVGSIDAKPGEYARKVGLVWRGDGDPIVVSAEADVALNTTDGTAVAGNIRGKAALWSSPDAAPSSLHPEKLFMSDVQAIDGEIQAGSAWKGMRSRAAIWRGTAESFVDVTPKAFQVGLISASAGGYQVGSVRAKENTKNGTPGSDNRAMLWQGAADRTFDLHALLDGTPYNASSAMAIEVDGGIVRICGQASRYEVDRAGTAHEQHVLPEAVPVLWMGTLSG